MLPLRDRDKKTVSYCADTNNYHFKYYFKIAMSMFVTFGKFFLLQLRNGMSNEQKSSDIF